MKKLISELLMGLRTVLKMGENLNHPEKLPELYRPHNPYHSYPTEDIPPILMEIAKADAFMTLWRTSAIDVQTELLGTRPPVAELPPCEPALMPTNKKAQAINQMAGNVASSCRFYIVEGDIILIYDDKSVRFVPTRSPERLLHQLFSEDAMRDMLPKDRKDLIELAKSRAECQCSYDEFNHVENCVSTEIGVLNWKTGNIRPHAPTDKFTYKISARFVNEKEKIYAPTWVRFCQTSLGPAWPSDPETDQQIIAQKSFLLLCIIGYILSDSDSAKVAFFLQGEPDTGKSQILDFIARLLPKDVIADIPLDRLDKQFNKAAACGKKLIKYGETKGKKLQDITTFKAYTGHDEVEGEFKKEDLFFFTPRCKLLFAGNTLPSTSESDATVAFVNRLVVLKFNRSIPKEEQDPHLLDKLMEERDSIFTLAMQALKELAANNYHFKMPKESLDFLESYRSRSNSAVMFVQDMCRRGPEHRVHKCEFYKAYQQYCAENALEVYGSKAFFDMIAGLPGIVGKKFRLGDQNRQGLVGICLKNRS